MRWMIIPIAIGLGALSLAPAAWAQPARVQGQVVDASTGEPLPGANVLLVRSGEQAPAAGAATDVQGRYSLQASAGSYRLLVRFVGYEEAERPVTLEAGRTLTVDFALRATPLLLNPVVVTGSRRPEKVLDAPMSISVLEARELERNALPNTAAVLRTVPGVDVSQSALNRYQISLRGFNTVFVAKTYALVDYRQATTPSLGINEYSAMPISPLDVARIEVVRGPGSALYGAGVEQGVVHFITKDPFAYPGTSLMVGGGQRAIFQGALRHAAILGNRFAYKIVGQYSRGEDWKLDPNDPHDKAMLDAIHPKWGGRDYTTYNGYASLTLQYRLGSDAMLTGTAGYSQFRQTVLANTGENAVKDFSVRYAQLRLRAGGFFAQIFYTGNDGGKTHFYRSPIDVVERSFLTSGQAQYSWSMWRDRQQFVLGLDYRRTVPRTGGTIHGRFEDRDNMVELGGYLQSQTSLLSNLDLVLTGRLDRDNVIRKVQFSPRVGLVYKPSASHSLRATYNRAFTTPAGINFFIDLFIEDRGPFGVRGVGTVDGWTFAAQPQTSSFIPGVRAWPGIGIPLQVAYTAVTSAITASGQPLAPLRTLLLSRAPQITGFSAGSMIDAQRRPVTRLENVPQARQTITNSWELGYKGLFGGRLAVSLDLYYTRKRNFLSELQPFTPLVAVPRLPDDLANAVAAAFTDAELHAFGLTRAQLAAIYRQAAASIAANPIGLIEPQENFNPNRKPELLLSYITFGRVSYYGADLALQWYPNPRWSLWGNLSWLSDTYFDDEELGEPGTGREIAMNAPRIKARAGAEYAAPAGWSLSLTGQYVDGFEVRSGIFSGRVEDYFLLDVGAGYDLSPVVRGLRLDVLVQNALDHRHRQYIGAPKIGRLITARLLYALP
ncbi:MAG: TonB-dependent receptor [Bacteroidota bacterium]|nr:TonB-dependent receptor [Rhodothermia bacterium]MDW8285087.1 TonB-dependent receptor [Bacteroidota bacterium]